MKDFHFSKTFLNKDGYLGIAAILTSITFSKEDKMWHTIELKISDCRNEINLDLTLEDDGTNNYENSMHKVNTLIEQLGYLRVKMQEGKEEFDRRKGVFEANKAKLVSERMERARNQQKGGSDEDNNGTSSPNT
jgi:hypothetical protein